MTVRMQTSKLRLFASIALALPIMAAAQIIAPVYSLSPNPAPADQAFTLYLLGSYGCSNSFSHESATVTNNRIDLAYVANSGPIIMPLAQAKQSAQDIVCPMNAGTTGMPISPSPSFQMPALKAGVYQVYATEKQACEFSLPACTVLDYTDSIGTLTVQAGGTMTYSFTPTQTVAGKAFDMHLTSTQFDCGTTFDHLSSTVAGNQITLTFLDTENPNIGCVSIIGQAYGPSYSIGSLSAGAYTVYASRLPACAAQGCKAAPTLTEVGTLTVTDSTTKDAWFIKPREVKPDLKFSLQLLNYKYGSCGTVFTHQSVSVQSGGIYFSFLPEQAVGIECFANITPWGPTFDMDALKEGKYPIYVTELLRCQVIAPICPILRIMPQVSDTLYVTKSAGIFIKHAQGGEASAFAQGSRLSVQLPSGFSGIWHADLLTLSGRAIQGFDIEAEGGLPVTLDLAARPQRGVYLLKLENRSGTAGETRTLPIAFKD